MNNHTVSEANNHKSIDSTEKSDGNTHNRPEMESYRLQDGVEIDVMFPVSTLNQYDNMEYKQLINSFIDFSIC